jgi:polynucleotide 5'-kinase involved in rRNA processing
MDQEKKIEIPLSDEKPTCCIVIGMAGSGKTTFIQVVVKVFP